MGVRVLESRESVDLERMDFLKLQFIDWRHGWIKLWTDQWPCMTAGGKTIPLIG